MTIESVITRVEDTSPPLLWKNRLYASETCGICERKEEGEQVFWMNPTSRMAHVNCVKMISAAENKLTGTIHCLFRYEQSRKNHNWAHLYAIAAVKAQCWPYSLREFCRMRGEKAITELFNTVGIEAAKKFAKTHMPTEAKL